MSEVPGGWSEDRLHRWLAQQSWPEGLVGSRGHDAAVLAASGERAVLCADQCIEGVHFAAGVAGSVAGAKAVLRTISDLAATGAQPAAVTFAVRAPETCEEAWIRDAIQGARAAAVRCGAELVAGDLSAAPGAASFVVTAFGHLAGDRTPVGRDRARPGQIVVLTGPVGGSLEGGRHLAPTPRLDEGVKLAEAGATAMMDVSDGLGLDLFRMARASDVGIELDADSVPIHPDARAASATTGRTALDHALHDGEDHELIATVDVAASLLAGWTAIGRVVVGEGLVLLHGDRRAAWHPDQGGWTHGGVCG